MKDIFAIQDEISEAIVNTLTAKLVKDKPKAPARRSTVDLEAYNLYLKGRYHWNRRTNAAMLRAIEYFRQALDRDPNYALGHAGIADCYTLLGWVAFGALPPREAFPKAEAAALKAIEIDESLAEAYNSLGWTRLVYNWDWDAADQAFTRAIALNPRYAMAHSWYGVHLGWMGKMDEAIAEATEAERLDPLSLIIHTLAGWVFYFARRYQESVEHYRKTLELDPHYVRAHLGLGWAYEQLGILDEAVAEFERGVQLSEGSPRYLGALGHAYAIAGKRREAMQQIDKLRELSRSQYVSPSYVAAVYAGLGDNDPTFEWLEKAFDERSGALVFLRMDPQMERLRSDPRFDELVKRVGFDQTPASAHDA